MRYPQDTDVRSMQEVAEQDPRFAAETADAPQAEVPHALMRLERANSQLHEVVKVLHERLQPVRHQSDEGSGESSKAVRGYSSELARVIGDQANRAEIASEVIIKILNELEV